KSCILTVCSSNTGDSIVNAMASERQHARERSDSVDSFIGTPEEVCLKRVRVLTNAILKLVPVKSETLRVEDRKKLRDMVCEINQLFGEQNGILREVRSAAEKRAATEPTRAPAISRQTYAGKLKQSSPARTPRGSWQKKWTWFPTKSGLKKDAKKLRISVAEKMQEAKVREVKKSNPVVCVYGVDEGLTAEQVAECIRQQNECIESQRMQGRVDLQEVRGNTRPQGLQGGRGEVRGVPTHQDPRPGHQTRGLLPDVPGEKTAPGGGADVEIGNNVCVPKDDWEEDEWKRVAALSKLILGGDAKNAELNSRSTTKTGLALAKCAKKEKDVSLKVPEDAISCPSKGRLGDVIDIFLTKRVKTGNPKTVQSSDSDHFRVISQIQGKRIKSQPTKERKVDEVPIPDIQDITKAIQETLNLRPAETRKEKYTLKQKWDLTKNTADKRLYNKKKKEEELIDEFKIHTWAKTIEEAEDDSAMMWKLLKKLGRRCNPNAPLQTEGGFVYNNESKAEATAYLLFKQFNFVETADEETKTTVTRAKQAIRTSTIEPQEEIKTKATENTVFPSVWKKPEIITLPKGSKDTTQLGNRRPISLINGMPKIADIFVKDRIRITSYLEVNNRKRASSGPASYVPGRFHQECHGAQEKDHGSSLEYREGLRQGMAGRAHIQNGIARPTNTLGINYAGLGERESATALATVSYTFQRLRQTHPQFQGTGTTDLPIRRRHGDLNGREHLREVQEQDGSRTGSYSYTRTSGIFQ
ncbi:hypothetical protein Trydic_g10543, partial [Trypoxylus dichotomus]